MKKTIPQEDLPTREGGAIRKFGRNSVRLNRHEREYASECRRMLNGAAGKKWDDIYSFICSDHHNEDKTKIFGWLKKNLHWMITFNCKKVDGKYYDHLDGPLRSYTYRSFCIVDGVIHKLPYRNKYIKREKQYKTVDGRHIIKVEGIYYEFTFKQFEKTPDGKNYDLLYKIRMSRWDCLQHYGAAIVATSKKQLGKKDLKKLRDNGFIE